MKWQKKGLIYEPDGSIQWAKKYAFPPVPHLRKDGILRIYLAFCDDNTVGRLGFVDVNPENPAEIIAVSQQPLLDIGQPGAFDENGLLPTSIVVVGSQLYLYYVGYQLGHKLRYYQFQGLAISKDDGETFCRYRRTPIIDRSDAELVNRTSAFVMEDDGLFKMWYVGGSEWTDVNGKSLPVYNMRYLESADGKEWGPEGQVVLDFANDDEHAFGKPWIIKSDQRYKMFYSFRCRSNNYRLGYAESSDGKRWERMDNRVGIDVSESGWDSQMIAYASIFSHGHQTYMFYNGNNCGQSGFGFAELKER